MAAGVDSLASTELVKKLSVELDSDIPSTLLFDHPSIDAIATYLDSSFILYSSNMVMETCVLVETRPSREELVGLVS